jgi:ABC-type sugar transport system ATPase subunit
MTDNETYLLRMENISKRFPGVQALRGVNFSVKQGEIISLLGENGAGKSTLMKILTGVYKPDEGRIVFNNEEVRFRSTRQAYEQGISIVFQEFNLCPNLSAMENLFLGNEEQAIPGILSYRRMREKARESFQRLKLHINPDTLVRNLGVAQQQMIEVAKALSHETRILIMDEPTSALTDTEISNLFEIMRILKRQGISIVFISHKLQEVLDISDRVICLRDGENSGEITTADASENDLVSMMVGREIDHMYSRRKGKPSDEIVLEIQDLSGPPIISDVSFSLRKGEVLGLAGLIGAGRTELARLIIGAEKKTAGTILLDGKKVSINHPADAVRLNIGYVPENRKEAGLILPMSVRENMTMSIHGAISNRLGFISGTREREVTDQYINRLQIKVTGREQVARNLSGGNQQKVVIGKWLAIKPEVLILDEPTRGIDVGAKAEVHAIISELADRGVAIIMISSELPEILHVSDRVLVMHEGRVTADIPRADADEETIMKAAVS